MPQSLSKQAPWDSHTSSSISSTIQNILQNPLLESPSAALWYFPESHWWSKISSLSKVILVLGKARSCRVPNLDLGLSHLGDLMFHKKLCTKHDAWASTLSWWSCQSPVTHSCSLLSHLNNFHRGMCKLNPKSDADSLLYLLSQFECDSRTVHMLTQWHLLSPLTSTGKSSLFTHVHSSPLSLAAKLRWCQHPPLCCANLFCYINNSWTLSGQASYKYVNIYLNFHSF